MSDLKQSYCQLKQQLQELMEQLQDPEAWSVLQEKEKQLQAIERTLQKMNKSGITIPVEMREAKLRLIKELENGQELNQVRSGLAELLLSALEELGYDAPKEQQTVRKRQKRPNAKGKRISLEQLCTAGLLHDGMALHHYGREGQFEAVIKNGKMLLKKGHSTLEFDNPSAAAIEAAGGSRNGWTFWVLNYHNKIVELDTIRKAYKKA
jgi:hypothetical protein